MGEYFYNKNRHSWMDISENWSSIYDHTSLSDEKVNDLRNARKNGKFIVVKNRYRGINSEYLYIDVDDYKLSLSNGAFYFITKTSFSTSRMIYYDHEIINLKFLESLPEDVKYAKDFVGTLSDVCNRPGGYNKESSEEYEKYKKQALNLLSERARLYYEIET